MAEAFHLAFDLPIVTVRPFNTFGPRQSARAIIPTIIVQALTGNVIRLGNLHPTRDLNFVTNTVDGFLCAGSNPSAVGKTINIGSGREISVGDLATLIANMVNKSVQIVNESERLRPQGSEVERLIADNTLAQNLLGWQPKVSLEEGLTRTIAWMQDNLEHYRSNYVY
jgi:dTDP-glucose 4,6-dehydratase